MPHRKRVRRHNVPGHLHELTFSCCRRKPLLTNDRWRRLLADSLQAASDPNGAVKSILAAADSPLLRQLTVRERPGKTCFRFWQEGSGYDRNLFTARAIEASLGYLHTNPVRRGLVSEAVKRKWSSARFYYLNEVDPELPEIRPLDPRWVERTGVQTEHG